MIHSIDGMLEAAKLGKRGIIAVAAAHDDMVLEAVANARKEGLADAILVSHGAEIRSMLTAMGEDSADYEIAEGAKETDCATKAVALCAEAKANFLMKGIINTTKLASIAAGSVLSTRMKIL